MSFLFPTTSPAAVDALDASWMHQPLVYIAIAAICLLIALRFLKRAIAPIGALIQAVAAAALVAFTAVIALAMLVLAAVTTAQ